MRIGKYNNRRCSSGWYNFDSKLEREYYHHLLWREKAGEIKDLTIKPVMDLLAYVIATKTYKNVGKYIPDFAYFNKDGERIIIDVKGTRTSTYMLKKKIVEACYGIKITEVTKKSGRWVYK